MSASATVAAPGVLRLAHLPPLALYVHIPWCIRKCPYCDFNSHEAKGAAPEKRYVEALVADLESELPRVWGRRVGTVFFGGGTPSLFAPESIDAILAAVRARLPLAVDAEITLEANPGTFEAGKFREFRAAGVNRLSVGIQSFDDRFLEALGRVHDAAEARRAVEIALSTFENVNLDLMYALPGQRLDEARADIAAAIAFRPQHVSAYHLTIEPNTYFAAHPPAVPDNDAAADMQEAIEADLAAAGYEHYETSAFAQPGRRCRHNLNYWQFGDYIGIGAGAHGKISFADRMVREMRFKQPKAWMDAALAGDAVLESVQVLREALPFEFMMNALRLHEGVPVAMFAERTGLNITAIEARLAEAARLGLLELDHARLRPTARGRRFLNDLLQVFL
jgi:putative oxygen-independent coproporphyrinogen III oxidase